MDYLSEGEHSLTLIFFVCMEEVLDFYTSTCEKWYQKKKISSVSAGSFLITRFRPRIETIVPVSCLSLSSPDKTFVKGGVMLTSSTRGQKIWGCRDVPSGAGNSDSENESTSGIVSVQQSGRAACSHRQYTQCWLGQQRQPQKNDSRVFSLLYGLKPKHF